VRVWGGGVSGLLGLRLVGGCWGVGFFWVFWFLWFGWLVAGWFLVVYFFGLVCVFWFFVVVVCFFFFFGGGVCFCFGFGVVFELQSVPPKTHLSGLPVNPWKSPLIKSAGHLSPLVLVFATVVGGQPCSWRRQVSSLRCVPRGERYVFLSIAAR